MELDVGRFSRTTVLVVGDVMVDEYIWGNVDRISPEAPVPVVTVERKTRVIGGAGNVAANLAGLGVKVVLAGICGDDEEGAAIRHLCMESGITPCLVVDTQRSTTLKTRVMGGKQQLFRLDREASHAPGTEVIKEIFDLASAAMESVDAVVLSDYAKGMLTDLNLCRSLITRARERQLPCLVDPKGKNWGRYAGATCITPNTAELAAVSRLPLAEEGERLVSAMVETRDRYGIECLLLTMGPRGMCVVDKTAPPLFIPTTAREVYDVSGAGDTVISTVAAAMAVGLSPREAAGIANIAAGIVVEKVGTQPVFTAELVSALGPADIHCPGFQASSPVLSLHQAVTLMKRWRSAGDKVVFTNGCFDLLHPGHIDLLHRSKALGDRLVVGLNSDASVSGLKGPGRPIVSENDRAALLNALACVDAVVVFNEETPLALLTALVPDILVKGADYSLDEIVGREVVEAAGGRVARVPLMPGYSTTGIEQRIIDNHMI